MVLAEDRFQDLRMTRRTRTFADVSDADVISQVAGDHGLTPSVGVSGPTHKVLAQVNQSDLAFLRERARALDAELWVSDSTLNVQPRASRGGSPVTLTYGKELRELRVLADLAGQRTSLEVTGWDVSGKQALDRAGRRLGRRAASSPAATAGRRSSSGPSATARTRSRTRCPRRAPRRTRGPRRC